MMIKMLEKIPASFVITVDGTYVLKPGDAPMLALLETFMDLYRSLKQNGIENVIGNREGYQSAVFIIGMKTGDAKTGDVSGRLILTCIDDVCFHIKMKLRQEAIAIAGNNIKDQNRYIELVTNQFLSNSIMNN